MCVYFVRHILSAVLRALENVPYGDCFPCSLRWKKPQRLREGSGRVPDATVLRAVLVDPQTLRPSDPFPSTRALPWPREDEGSAVRSTASPWPAPRAQMLARSGQAPAGSISEPCPVRWGAMSPSSQQK